MGQFTVRRVVTGHDERGGAVCLADEPIEANHMTVVMAKGNKSGDFVGVWSTKTMPADNVSYAPPAQEVHQSDVDRGVVFHEGIVFRIVEIPPGSSSPMHRTQTIDYGSSSMASVISCSTAARSGN